MELAPFKSAGRIFYAVGIMGIGLVHFVLPGLRPIIAPLPPDAVWGWFGYAVGMIITISGLAIFLNRGSRIASISLVITFLLFLLIVHLPNRLKHHPEIMGYWTDAIKLLALTGGALLMARLDKREVTGIQKYVNQVSPYGKYLFAFMLLMFGLGHLLNAESLKGIVPDWIPGALFWTYFTGVALMGAGLSILINVRVRKVMLLLALMLFLWLLMVHLPSTFKYPFRNPKNSFADGNLVISSFQCLAFCGIALVLSAQRQPNRNQ